MTVRGLLQLDCVLLNSAARSPQEAFDEAAFLLGAAHGLRVDAFAERLAAREVRASTALGGGIAIPHADSFTITRPRAAFVRSRHSMGFVSTPDGAPVREVFVLAAPRPAMALHREMLLHYRALLTNAAFLTRLRTASEREQVWRLFREHECSVDPHAHGRPARRGVARSAPAAAMRAHG